MKPVAAFLDRDGVINEERGYVSHADEFRLLPGAIEGLLLLQSAGYQLVVVTNQAGIARGFYSEDDYLRLTQFMQNSLANQGVTLHAVYYSPYHPIHGKGRYQVESECRKPKPGMLFRAQDELDIDLSRSILIGDKRSDVEAGRAAGLQCNVLVESGHIVTESDIAFADGCFLNLKQAAQWILENCRIEPLPKI